MSYSYDRFLRPLTESDKSIKILDNSNIVKYTIDPFAIPNLLVSNNIIKINLRSQKVILIDFNSKNEAILGLSRLQQQVDFLTSKVPTQVDKEIVKYVQNVFDQLSIIVGPTGPTGPTGSQYYSFNNITSSVIAGTYTVTNGDFLKTLVYTGTASIDLLITSSLTFVEGESITILQKSSGQINVVGSGVVINTTSDVFATTYGANSIAEILVYSASSPEVIVSGKLKFV